MRVNVADLIGYPGATRDLERSITPEDVGDDPWGPAQGALGDRIDLDLGIDAVVEGLWVHGSVRWQLHLDCGRCLRAVVLDRDAEVGELFADPRKLHEDEEPDEGYEILVDVGDIDLERMLHDLVVLDVPTSVRCGRPDCEAPVRDGVDVLREDEAAELADAAPDPRWAALADLDLTD